MATMDYSTIHEEHYEAQCEHEMWLEDIEHWEGDHQQTEVMLEEVRAALRDHGVALRDHAETIKAHDVRAQLHEEELVDFERGGNPPDPDHAEPGGLHREFQHRHEGTRQAHQRIKEHHDMIMAAVHRLYKDLKSAM